MDAKIVAAIVSSTVASLIVAFLNWNSTRRLETMKRSYGLLSKDLERLLSIKTEFLGVTDCYLVFGTLGGASCCRIRLRWWRSGPWLTVL